MKRLMKLIKNNNLEFGLEYCPAPNKYKMTARQGRTAAYLMLDAFDVSRSYSNRELEDVMIDYICSNFRLEKEDEY